MLFGAKIKIIFFFYKLNMLIHNLLQSRRKLEFTSKKLWFFSFRKGKNIGEGI